MRKVSPVLSTISALLVLISLATFHACKKEKIIVQGSRTDTILIQYAHCQYDTTLPINCYTTGLTRSGAERLYIAQEDTLVIYNLQCITFGHCRFEEFYPYYTLCYDGPSAGRIPDTAMCRAAGIPLCCPAFSEDLDDTPTPDLDISEITLRLKNICKNKTTGVYFYEVGQTQYLEHPDSNPNYSCQAYLQYWSLVLDSTRTYKFKNCSIRLIEYPKKFDHDTITVYYYPQGPDSTLIPCCAGDVNLSKPPTYDLFKTYVKIGLQCN